MATYAGDTIDAKIRSAQKTKAQYEKNLKDIKKQINKLVDEKDSPSKRRKEADLRSRKNATQKLIAEVTQDIKTLEVSGQATYNLAGGTDISDLEYEGGGNFANSLTDPFDQLSFNEVNRNIPAKNYTDHTTNTHTHTYLSDYMSNYGKLLFHSNNMFSERELDIYSKTYRYGYFNTQTLGNGREFLFFTKPDLNIMDDQGKALPYYDGIAYWQDLVNNRPEIVRSLQVSKSKPSNDYFNHLLQNQVISNLDIPGLSAPMIETATNDYGVGYSYRGSSEASDDNPEFSLEFKDTKWLDVFTYFKSYEYYETMKHHGVVAPDSFYIMNRVIHDQFAIFKFIVAEDLETIVYWGKMYGVSPKSLPRDAFSNVTFDNGISYSIDFQAAFYEDMVPDILSDFNALSRKYYNSLPYKINIYNTVLGMSDGRPAKAAIVKLVKSNKSPSGYVYKLKWRGDELA